MTSQRKSRAGISRAAPISATPPQPQPDKRRPAPEIREALERERRAHLHRQIGALEAKLEEVYNWYGASRAIARIKLKHKIAGLYAELNQPMFMEITTHDVDSKR